MRKFLLGLALLAGVASVNADASPRRRVIVPVIPVVPVVPVVPVRPCVYRMVPVTSLQLVWTAFGYQYQYVTTYAYQLVCY